MADFFWWMRSIKDWAGGRRKDLPEQMKMDPLLRNLNVSGPFGPSHDRLRRAYYDLRDDREPDQPRERLRSDFEYICYRSPGLWQRQQDDTPQELSIICSKVRQMFEDDEFRQ